MEVINLNSEHSIILSVCVPTYNRESYLKNFFYTAKSEYLENIEFVIVDDGSTDNTSKLCSKLNSKFHIKYIYQNNSGRSHALRKSILNASGEYVLIMDSDDMFTERGLDVVISTIYDYKLAINKLNLAGFVFLMSNIENNIIGDKFKDNSLLSNILKFRSDLSISGEKKEVIKTKILVDVMYIPFYGEKRIATSILWDRLSVDYDVICFNKVVGIKDYVNSGLTNNLTDIRINSCRSSALYYSELVGYFNTVYFSYRFAYRATINLIRFSLHCKSFFFLKQVNININIILLFLLATPVSMVVFILDVLGFNK